MTKTLTEQWREGTLPAGCYYVLSTEDDTPVACDIDVVCDFMIRDVIAPVPSYNEFLVLSGFKKIEKDAIDKLVKIHTEKLEKKLEIATKALKDIKVYSQRDWDEYNCMECSDKALKEMEGVK